MRELWNKYKEMIMYLIFGVATTVVNWVVYGALMQIPSMSMTIANAIAWAAAVLFAFVTNKWFVFESKTLEPASLVKEFGMFVGSRVLTGIIEIAGLPILYYLGMNQSIFGVEGFAAKIVVSVVVIILNYVFSKILVFKDKK